MSARSRWLLPAIVLALGLLVFATTWGPTDVTCPVCHTKQKFNSIMSYGGYIYAWPSKFQLIYWPTTDGNVVYTCKKCALSLFMWDFTEFPTSKAPAVERALVGVKLDREYENYIDIPMSQRLALAEKVYNVLDESDEFWCRFYRIQAYHLAIEKKSSEADAARGKALILAEKMIGDSGNAGRMKELLLIRGAMHHFLRDDAAAKQDIEAALHAEYEDKKLTKEENKNANLNLNALAKEYLDGLAANRIPKDDGSDPPPPDPAAKSSRLSDSRGGGEIGH